MNKVSNGWSDKPEMAPRPFKYCPGCTRPLAGGETRCQTCAQTEKGITPDAIQRPFDLPTPRPELEGGK